MTMNLSSFYRSIKPMNAFHGPLIGMLKPHQGILEELQPQQFSSVTGRVSRRNDKWKSRHQGIPDIIKELRPQQSSVRRNVVLDRRRMRRDLEFDRWRVRMNEAYDRWRNEEFERWMLSRYIALGRCSNEEFERWMVSRNIALDRCRNEEFQRWIVSRNIALDRCRNIAHNAEELEPQQFSLDTPRVSINGAFDLWRNTAYTAQVLEPGMVLLKKYLTIIGQVDMFKICQEGAMGPAGFYRPRNRSGVKLRLDMMCFGRNWDPVTRYEKRYRSEGPEPPPLPYEFISLVENIIKDAQGHLDELPLMCPDICVANFYSDFGRLGLHQDLDESTDSLKRGLPVVSVSIGNSAEFFYGHTRDENKLERVVLESGDVLIFGGKSRLVFHGVKTISACTSPTQLSKETGLIVGRLNLTLRQF